MESLDLASKISTKEIYCWKNNNKKKFNFSQINNKSFILVIDFGVKKILNLLENMGYLVVVCPAISHLKKLLNYVQVEFFYQMVREIH